MRDLINSKSPNLEVMILKWSTTHFTILLFGMNSQFVAESSFSFHDAERMSSWYSGIFARVPLYASVHAYVCAYPPRVYEKRRDTHRERKGREERIRTRERIGRITESSFTPFDSFAVRDTYALLASSCVCTPYARTIFGSSSLRICRVCRCRQIWP